LNLAVLPNWSSAGTLGGLAQGGLFLKLSLVPFK